MKEFKTIIFIACGMLFGYLFKEDINQLQPYKILYPTLFALAILGMIYNKYKVFKLKTFIKTKYDDIKQVSLTLAGITIIILTIYYWLPNSYFHWLSLLLGVGTVISNIFYESTIQLYIKTDKLHIQYSGSSYYNFDKVDSFDLQNGTLKIYFDETRIEVYKVKMESSNIEKLTDYLSKFQRKDNANIQ